MENTYWNHQGKHQQFLDQLEARIPRFGYTSNVYVNLMLAMSHLYYDAYNNGGGNICNGVYTRHFHTYVEPYLHKKVDLDTFSSCLYDKMETMMDLALEYISDKDLSFPVYTVWLDADGYTMSRAEPPVNDANSSKWRPVTFGTQEELESWFASRKAFTQDVTQEIQARIEPSTKSVVREGCMWFALDDDLCISVWYAPDRYDGDQLQMKLEKREEDGNMGPFCEILCCESFATDDLSYDAILNTLLEVRDCAIHLEHISELPASPNRVLREDCPQLAEKIMTSFGLKRQSLDQVISSAEQKISSPSSHNKNTIDLNK